MLESRCDMVSEFCGFNKGVIGKKLPSDSTLKNMRKEELINLLRLAQHNYGNLMWFYNNVVNANMSQLNNNGWIPCSERLPEDCACYLVAWMDERNLPVPFYEIVNFEDGYWTDNIEQAVGAYRILAWQPLPAPYTEGE